jgi:hypothetical protein
LEEAEEGFFLLFLATNRLTSMTAERAEFEEFAAAAPEAVNAFVAEYLTAICALIRGTRVFVPRTYQAAIRQDNGRGRTRHFKFWDGNSYVCALDEEINIAQAQDLTRRELGFHDWMIVDVGPVGGTAIADSDLSVAQGNFAMFGGNRSVLDDEIVSGGTTKAINPKIEVDYLVIKAWRLNH